MDRYTLLLDDIDINLLPAHVYRNLNQPIPLWSSRNNNGKDYYEFEVITGELTQEKEDICYEEAEGCTSGARAQAEGAAAVAATGQEATQAACHATVNNDKYRCHLCNIDVPKAGMRSHKNGPKHKICLTIAQKSLERLTKQMTEDFDPPIEYSSYFCDTCALFIDLQSKDIHDKSQEHVVSLEKDLCINNLLKLYIGQDDAGLSVEKSIIDDRGSIDATPDATNDGIDDKNDVKVNYEVDGEISDAQYDRNDVNSDEKKSQAENDTSKMEIEDVSRRNGIQVQEIQEETYKKEVLCEINENSNKENSLNVTNNIDYDSEVSEANGETRAKKRKLFREDTEFLTRDKRNTVNRDVVETKTRNYIEINTDTMKTERKTKVNKAVTNNIDCNSIITKDKEVTKAEKAKPVKVLTTDNLKSIDKDVEMRTESGDKMQVQADNFHGFVYVGDEVHCIVCLVVIEDKAAHVLSDGHVEKVSPAVTMQCVRQIDGTWNHCILCNEIVESAELHTTYSEKHKILLKRGVNSSIRGKKLSSNEGFTYCDICDVMIPVICLEDHAIGNRHKKQVKRLRNKEKDVKSTVHHHMKACGIPSEVICRVCGVILPKNQSIINNHVEDYNHVLKYKSILTFNKVIKANGKAFCELCEAYVIEDYVLLHIHDKIHKKLRKTKNCKTRGNNDADTNDSRKELPTKIYEELRTDTPSLNDEDSSDSEDTNVTNLNGNVGRKQKKKSKKEKRPHCHFELTDDPKQLRCKVCDILIDKHLQIIKFHRKGPNHTAKYNSILNENLIDRHACNKYICKICDLTMIKKLAIDHILSDYHTQNFVKYKKRDLSSKPTHETKNFIVYNLTILDEANYDKTEVLAITPFADVLIGNSNNMKDLKNTNDVEKTGIEFIEKEIRGILKERNSIEALKPKKPSTKFDIRTIEYEVDENKAPIDSQIDAKGILGDNKAYGTNITVISTVPELKNLSTATNDAVNKETASENTLDVEDLKEEINDIQEPNAISIVTQQNTLTTVIQNELVQKESQSEAVIDVKDTTEEINEVQEPILAANSTINEYIALEATKNELIDKETPFENETEISEVKCDSVEELESITTAVNKVSINAFEGIEKEVTIETGTDNNTVIIQEPNPEVKSVFDELNIPSESIEPRLFEKRDEDGGYGNSQGPDAVTIEVEKRNTPSIETSKEKRAKFELAFQTDDDKAQEPNARYGFSLQDTPLSEDLESMYKDYLLTLRDNHLMKLTVNPKEVYCKACQTTLLNTKAVIHEHCRHPNHVSNYFYILGINKFRKVHDKLHCDLCKIYVTVTFEFYHMEDSLHKQLLREDAAMFGNPFDPNFALTIINPSCYPSSVNAQTKPKNFTEPQTNDSDTFIVTTPTEELCKFCNVQIPNTEYNLSEHVKGSKHLNKLKSNVEGELQKDDAITAEPETKEEITQITKKSEIIKASVITNDNSDVKNVNSNANASALAKTKYDLNNEAPNNNEIKINQPNTGIVKENTPIPGSSSSNANNPRIPLAKNKIKSDDKVKTNASAIPLIVEDNNVVVSNSAIPKTDTKNDFSNATATNFSEVFQLLEKTNELFCKACKVKIYNNDVNIIGHSKGIKHMRNTSLNNANSTDENTLFGTNFLDIFDVRDDGIYCMLCNELMSATEESIFDHARSLEHKVRCLI